MKLFSKRNSHSSELNGSGFIRRFPRNHHELISLAVRNRLISELKFLTSSNDFLEWFILFENQKEEKIFLDRDKIDNFSLSELGYRMSGFFEFKEFAMIEQVRDERFSDRPAEKYFDDYKLFDLAEIIILFSLSRKRTEVISRFNTIFSEEEADFQIVEHLITIKSGESLKTLVSLLKDEGLKTKIKMYFNFYERLDFLNSSKISADIINIVFSGFLKGNKANDIKELKRKLGKKILEKTTEKEEKEARFFSYIDDLLKVSKNLSNEIYDIRHTEKSTIQLTNENIYKLVSNQNMAIVELFLTTLKDEYVLGDNWEKIKSDYIKKYNIDKNTRYIIRKPTPPKAEEDDLKIEDIPF